MLEQFYVHKEHKRNTKWRITEAPHNIDVFTSERERSFLFLWNWKARGVGVRIRDIRISKQTALTTAPGLPRCPNHNPSLNHESHWQ